ncbi:hypothetical protein B0H66DRAFT_228369 [Apodospora peruviana]|uniref:Uncharacterized protein n=1 Tax=Apodospora peruviana TaxID=516989 RepID=A0AAE0M3Q1_9PEZI|nr:hypothetical protein B0H66DRAFT_228369 [Apodospora peruviana]
MRGARTKDTNTASSSGRSTFVKRRCFRSSRKPNDNVGGTGELVSDIHDKFWDTYRELWTDSSFIPAQVLSGLKQSESSSSGWLIDLARPVGPHASIGVDTPRFPVPGDNGVVDVTVLTDEIRLAFIAMYGHYRLLDLELRRLATKMTPDLLPGSLSPDRAGRECTRLLLRHQPMRPVIVVSDFNWVRLCVELGSEYGLQ